MLQTVCAIQLSSQDDVPGNLARAERLVGEAARAGAELVVLPENFAFMGDEEKKRAIAEPLALGGPSEAWGPIATALSGWAKRFGVHLVGGGMPERNEDAKRPFNTSALFAPDGALVARYRKVHLFDVDLPGGAQHEESRSTTAGDSESSVVSVRDVKVGMSICYDVRFPELFRKLTDAGAELVTVPAAFTLTTGKDHWHVLLRARAIENQVFVVAPAQTGKHGARATYGKSLVVDPWGDVLAQCGEGEGFALARISLDYQRDVRTRLPCLRHRRLG